MFVQILRGRATDTDALKRQLDTWYDDLSPGATGWLGSTGGVTEDGSFIASFRFETPAAAQANSDSSEQTQWWNATSKYLDAPRFWDCTLVEEYKGGGSDDAGFVQVIQGRVLDPAGFREAALSMGGTPRGDVVGGVVAWDGSRFTELVYFTSEEKAREGERSHAHTTALETIWPVTQDLQYFDLREPWLVSPKSG